MLDPPAASDCTTPSAAAECCASRAWLRSIPMRALIVTGLVVLLWFSHPAAPATSAVAPASLACGAVGTPSTVTTDPTAAPAATPAPAPSVVLHPIVDVPLPGAATRFDYQSLDETTGRLVIAHMG